MLKQFNYFTVQSWLWEFKISIFCIALATNQFKLNLYTYAYKWLL